jgi:hypothetical protein
MPKPLEKLQPKHPLGGPEKKHEPIHPLQAISTAFENARAQGRARKLAEQEQKQRFLTMQQQEEQRRRENTIREIQKALSVSPIHRQPGIRHGLALSIYQQSGGDPDAALLMAHDVITNYHYDNSDILKMHSETAEKREIALDTLDRLHKRPYRTSNGFGWKDKVADGEVTFSQIFKDKDKATALKKFIKPSSLLRKTARNVLGATDWMLKTTGKVFVAGVQGDLASVGDEITINDTHVVINGASERNARLMLELKDLQSGKVYLTPDLPKWSEPFVNFLSVFADNKDKAAEWVPWGQMRVMREGQDTPLAKIPVAYPIAKQLELEKMLEDSVMPPANLPDPRPVPEISELLETFAKETGIEQPAPATQIRGQAALRRRESLNRRLDAMRRGSSDNED